VKNLDIIVNSLGITYGIILILTVFVRTQFTELMRVDALLMPQPTESTRPVNLVIGLLVAGYGIYSLIG
jgi:hypothetical protein